MTSRAFLVLVIAAVALAGIHSASPSAPIVEAQSGGICDRTPQVQEAILTAINQSNLTCSGVTTTQLNGLTGTLSMDHAGITNLKAGDFAGLTGITALSMHRNRLKSFPAGVFTGLDAVTQFQFHGNELTTVPASMFDGFNNKANVVTIEITGNNLTTIEAGAFDGMVGLKNLYLSRNKIRSLPSGVFDGLAALVRVSLQFNELTSVPEDLFDKLNATKTACDRTASPLEGRNTTFKRFLADHNKFTTFPSGLFDCVSGLERVYAGFSSISSLPSGFLQHNAGLQLLSLPSNRLGALPANIFNGKPILWYVDLNDNNLTSLDGAGLVNATNISYLILNKNRLGKLPDAFVTPFVSQAANPPATGYCLIGLWLDENPLSASWLSSGKFNEFMTAYGTYDPRGSTNCALGALSDVIALGLSGVDLSTVVTGQSPKTAWDLLLEDFEHTDSNDALDRFTATYEFNFGWDGQTIDAATLGKLPVGIEAMAIRDARFASDVSGSTFARFTKNSTSLTAAYLPVDGVFSTLRTTHTPPTWEALNGLTLLDLHNVGLTGDGDPIINGLPTTMQRLLIRDNPGLTSVSDSVKSLTNLRILDLQSNGITMLGANGFSGLSKLIYLSAADNDISHVAAASLNGLTALEVLFLHENKIPSIPAGLLSASTKLETLYLNQNDLAMLPSEIFDGLTDLAVLDLRSNPSGANVPFHIGITTAADTVDTDETVLKVREGAPYTFFADIKDSGGTATGVVKVPAGTTTTTSATAFVLPTNGSVGFDTVLPHRPGNDIRWCLGKRPCLSGFELKYDPPARLIDVKTTSKSGNYVPGNAINFQVRYSEEVTVTGTPTMSFTLGGEARSASYVRTESGNVLHFQYVVVNGDKGRSGLSITNSQVSTPAGASIADSDDNPTKAAPVIAPSTGAQVGVSVLTDELKILRIEPNIRSLTTSAGDTARLAIDIYGLQNVLDNKLGDGVIFTWDDAGAGGSFDGTGYRSSYTMPDRPGTYKVTVTAPPNFCAEDTDTEALECSAEIEVKVRRSAPEPDPTPVAQNPSGEIPTVIVDSAGAQYEVFTPVEGGTFSGERFSFSASSGTIPNGELLGVRMVDAGPASNLGQTFQRYTLGGRTYDILAVNASGEMVNSYMLNAPANVCVPLPSGMGRNIADLAMVVQNSDGSLTLLSSAVRITRSGAQVCGALSGVPASVAVGSSGAPPAFTPTPMPTATPEPPDTGGTAPANSNALAWLMLLGIAIIAMGAFLLIGRRDRQPQ